MIVMSSSPAGCRPACPTHVWPDGCDALDLAHDLGAPGGVCEVLLTTADHHSIASWLVPATLHRVVRRQRPWTERIAIITREKQLADELLESDHAQVIWVIPPDFVGDLELPDRDVTIAVDLGSVLSERMAQFVSSCDVAGYRIRPFSSIYEEHTGRVPLVHVAEGWEISLPLLEVARWLPGKRIFDIFTTVLFAPLWLPLALLVGIYVKLADPRGNVIFAQERVGRGRLRCQVTMILMPRRAPLSPRARSSSGGRSCARRLDGSATRNVLKGLCRWSVPRRAGPFVQEFSRSLLQPQAHGAPGITGWAQVSYGYADDQADTVG